MPLPEHLPRIDPPRASPGTGVIVTGGASGLGLACAEALAAVGRPVAVMDINADGAAEAAERIRGLYGVTALGLGVDLRDVEALRQACEAARAGLPTIGGVVHCAGTATREGLEGFDPDVFDAGMSIHVRPIPLIVQAVLEDLRRNKGSAVVAIASMQARLGDGNLPTYTAAKGAVLSLVHSMADALAADGIRINSVSPGMIETPMLQRAMSQGPLREATVARTMLQRFGDPAEIGRAVRFLMSDEASYVTGTDLLVDGGYIPASKRYPPPG
jgi:NAD(P)-dependent dehydrogenase (short-subunit alcohol dehydrogenase family)